MDGSLTGEAWVVEVAFSVVMSLGVREAPQS
jgi:hypothetical protein